jgi:predicted patatin/cPLA2 family phospholipase
MTSKQIYSTKSKVIDKRGPTSNKIIHESSQKQKISAHYNLALQLGEYQLDEIKDFK